MTEPDILTPREACGCGVALAVIVGLAVLAFLVFGCAPRTVVIPSDREVVPIRATVPDEAAHRRTYVEDSAAATGWYVPDVVLIDLLAEPDD